MGIMKRVFSVGLVLMLVSSLFTGCGRKADEDAAPSATEAAKGDDGVKGAEVDETKAVPEESVNPAGNYDLWTYGSSGGDTWVDYDRDEVQVNGYVFLNEDHTGKMNLNASGTDAAALDISWKDDGSIEVYGNKLYTWELSGDVLTVTMGDGALKYYYVREGVDGAKAYQAFRQGNALQAASASSGDGIGAAEDAAYDDSLIINVLEDTRYTVCSVAEEGDSLDAQRLDNSGHENDFLYIRAGGEIDFDLGTRDLNNGDYYIDELYGAVTKYTDIEEPLYPYSFASDGDILFIKAKRDTLVLLRDDADVDAAIAAADKVPYLSIRDVDATNELTGYAPTPRDKKYSATGGSFYFDPATGTIRYIEPTVTEMDYPRGFGGIGLSQIKPGVYDAQALKKFRCAPDMFPVTFDPSTGKYDQDIFTSNAGFLQCGDSGNCGRGALGKLLFCRAANKPGACDYLGSIEEMENGPVFINANLGDYQKLIQEHSTNIADYRMLSGKDKEIKDLTDFVVDTDDDKTRIIERIGKFVNADYLYDYDTGRYDTKYVDRERVEKKNDLHQSLGSHSVLGEGRAYLMRDMCIAAGIPCFSVILGETPVDCSVYESYDDYYEDNHEEMVKSKHADDYANEEIPDEFKEMIDATYNSANMSEVYDIAYADGRWHVLDANGVLGLGKDIGPNGIFMRCQILEVDGKDFGHVDRQEYLKEAYDRQQDYTKKAIAKGELPDLSCFDHVLDDSGTYKLYDGMDEKGKVTLPEETRGKNEAWIRLDMDGTGEIEWYGFHSRVAWASNTGNSHTGGESRDTSGTRSDGKSREHGISARLIYIKDGEYKEQKFQVMEPYGESMVILDTNNENEDGYRYRFLKEGGESSESYGKSPWK